MISQIRWLQEHPATRNYLASKFGLPMGMGSEIVNGQIVSDGRTAKQLYEAFTVKALQQFTGSDLTDVNVMFNVACEIAKAELGMIPKKDEKSVPKESAPATKPDGTHGATAAKKGKGRTRKVAKEG
jgi:hypothetical protein